MENKVNIHKAWIKVGAEYAMQQALIELKPTLKEQEEYREFLKKLTSHRLHLIHTYLDTAKETNTLPDPKTITPKSSEQKYLSSLSEKHIWLALKTTEGMFKKHFDGYFG